jgi:polyisoprenoid-binding protein YceI
LNRTPDVVNIQIGKTSKSLNKEAQFKQITYKLTGLMLKEVPKAKDSPYVFESTGDLTVAGATKTIMMPVNILPLVDPKGEKRLEITGNVTVKMTDYNVAPVDINLVVGHIKTGDEVKLVFKWIVGQKKATSQ